MKNSILIVMFMLLLPISDMGQKQATNHLILPGKGHIDVEALGKGVNTKTDISGLSLSEIRVLRNAAAARQGYCFMSADLRSIFGSTTWYERRALARMESDKPMPPITYSKAESAFMARLKQREDELRARNFVVSEGERVCVDNIVNPFQLESFGEPLCGALARNGFAIVPKDAIQMFHIYENNDYHNFPSFVTTDMYLQLFHTYFDCLLRNVEEECLMPQLKDFSEVMYGQFIDMAAKAKEPNLRDAAQFWSAYYAIGLTLLTGKQYGNVEAPYKALAETELNSISRQEDAFSDFLDYHDAYFPYSLFRPRGHYTQSDSLKRYFKAMMWFQSAPCCVDNDVQLRRAVVHAEALATDNRYYKLLTETLTLLMGEPDNISFGQLADLLQEGDYNFESLMTDTSQLARLRVSLQAVAALQTRIRPKEQISCRDKLNLFPQRYMADSEVLQELVDVKSPQTKRACPKGLDVFAAFGCDAAQRILMDELKEGKQWPDYEPTLARMKQKMAAVDWNSTVTNKWMESLCRMCETKGQTGTMPYFMCTQQWDKKNLNAALSSWAELKHDAILYAKQPAGAECGGGGLPEPVVVGYVEPNVNYWKAAIELLDRTEYVLSSCVMLSDKARKETASLREMAEFLLRCSQKELAGKRLTDTEYNQIEYIGATFENLTLDLIKRDGQFLQTWDDVQGADRSIAVVADVYTANSSNNLAKSVLYEATAGVDEIYVVVPIDGYLYLTRGAVFSYREFNEPLNAPRLTDEEWQQRLKSSPSKGMPSWMQEIRLPDKSVPADNEKVFYSSGC